VCLVKIGAVKAVFYLRAKMNFYPTFSHLRSDWVQLGIRNLHVIVKCILMFSCTHNTLLFDHLLSGI